MAKGKALQLEDPGVIGLLRDYAALRTWEAIRGVRSVVTLSQLAESIGLDHRVLQRQVDLLALHGLIEVVKARRPRTSVGYRVTTDRIVVAFDDADPASVELAMAASASVSGEFDRCIKQHADPEFHPKAGFRFRHNSLQHFTKEDFAELRRRMLAVVEFLATPRPTQPKGSRAGGAPRPACCNQAISILFEPLVGDLLPLPAVWVTPRSKLSQADPRHAEKTGVGGLAPPRARGGARPRGRPLAGACRRTDGAVGAHRRDVRAAGLPQAWGLEPGRPCGKARRSCAPGARREVRGRRIGRIADRHRMRLQALGEGHHLTELSNPWRVCLP